MASFKASGSIADLQAFNKAVYAQVDDRMYSIWDLLGQTQRFGMRSLKGMRKGDPEKIRHNLLISLSWVMAIANRLHINVDDEVWKRFPMRCSYCGAKPCVCKKMKIKTRRTIKVNRALKPKSLAAVQKMFFEIYPPERRTLAEAGMHLAEEIGEVTEAVHSYLGQYNERQFGKVCTEIADYVSCVVGVANSADIPMGQALAKLFKNNCHKCHKAPCVCDFAYVINFKS